MRELASVHSIRLILFFSLSQLLSQALVNSAVEAQTEISRQSGLEVHPFRFVPAPTHPILIQNGGHDGPLTDAHTERGTVFFVVRYRDLISLSVGGRVPPDKDDQLTDRISAYIRQNAGLNCLSVFDRPGLKALPPLPSTLTRLRIVRCPDLENLPELPDALRSLELDDNPNLKSMPALPNALSRLEIQNTPVSHLSKLPSALTYFKLHNETGLTNLPRLPGSLADLRLFYCDHLKGLPTLPRNLRSLEVYHCSDLVSLPVLPSALVNLRVRHCPRLKTLPALPASVVDLEIGNCPLLKSLPNITNNTNLGEFN